MSTLYHWNTEYTENIHFILFKLNAMQRSETMILRQNSDFRRAKYGLSPLSKGRLETAAAQKLTQENAESRLDANVDQQHMSP